MWIYVIAAFIAGLLVGAAVTFAWMGSAIADSIARQFGWR